MNKKQYLVSLIIVAVFSFLGGIIGGMISDSKILAQSSLVAPDGSSYGKPKEIGYLKSGLISAEQVIAKEFTIQNTEGKTLIHMALDKKGNPYISFYSRETPKGLKIKFFDGHYEHIDVPMLNIFFEKDEPKIVFKDKDLDPRIILGIHNLQPSLDILYNQKPRIIIGTNNLITKKTESEEILKGSICIFDRKGKVLTQLPSDY